MIKYFNRKKHSAFKIRPLAIDAFKIDLESSALPPGFYAFYEEHPGLLEEWRQAWIRYFQRTKSPALKVPPRLVNDKDIVSA